MHDMTHDYKTWAGLLRNGQSLPLISLMEVLYKAAGTAQWPYKSCGSKLPSNYYLNITIIIINKPQPQDRYLEDNAAVSTAMLKL